MRRGDAAGLQIFTRGDEIVEHVLLVRKAPGIVPGVAIFRPAAEVGDGIDSAVLDPGDVGRAEARSQGDVEAAIAIEQRRCRTAGTLLAHDEHRYAGAVLRRVKPLLDHDRVGIERKLGCRPFARATAGRVVPVNCRRPIKAGEV